MPRSSDALLSRIPILPSFYTHPTLPSIMESHGYEENMLVNRSDNNTFFSKSTYFSTKHTKYVVKHKSAKLL